MARSAISQPIEGANGTSIPTRTATGAPPARTSQILVPMAATFVAVAVAVTAAVATDRLWLVLLLTAAGCVMAWTASVLLVRRLAGVRTA
ncbi:hypothetical protein SCYAM73S_01561 [Streptomyces cyaneofuscatus]